MSDPLQASKPGEGAPANPDLTKFVPKEEVGKLSQEIESLKKSLEDAKLELVSPEYIEFLSSKKNKVVTQTDIDKAKAAGLPPVALEMLEELKGRLVRTESVLQNMAAVLELQNVEKQFPDFNDYREDVQKLFEADKTGTLNFEQAYWQAKGRVPKPPKSDIPGGGNNKPGGFVPPEGSRKEFKSSFEASQDAINQVRTRHGISGDII